ncbi:MAG: hypothetical protein HDS70_06080 [Bacteroidales bacterium]|nr:hypothetical protein [Bacteroidales bacterium]
MKIQLICMACVAVMLTSCGKAKKVLLEIESDWADKTEVSHDTVVKVVYQERLQSEEPRMAPDEPRSKRLSVTGASYDWTLAPQGGNNYHPRNMFDGNRNTAWAAKIAQMPADADLYYGPTFYVNADRIDRIVLTNGYAKSNKAFRDNTRASHIIIARSNYDNEVEETYDAVLYEGPIKDTFSPQTLPVSPTYRHKKGNQKYQIIFSPGDFYYGDKWEDLCVSEMEFYGIASE